MTKYIDKYYLNGECYGIKFGGGGGGGWQPGANTLAYLPLNSTTQEVDQIGTWSFSSGVKATFGTYTSANVDCGYFTSSTGMQYTGSMPLYNKFTISAWLYTTWSSGDDGKVVDMATTTSDISGKVRVNICYYSGKYFLTREYNYQNEEVNATVANNSWHLVTIVADGSTSYIYDNGTLIGNGNITYTNDTMLSLNIGNQIWNALSRHYNGYASEIIIEDKARTEQEISDYYDQTKSLYGIS